MNTTTSTPMILRSAHGSPSRVRGPENHPKPQPRFITAAEWQAKYGKAAS